MSKKLDIPIVGQRPEIPPEALRFILMRVTAFQLRDRYDIRGSSLDRFHEGHELCRDMAFGVDWQKRVICIRDDRKHPVYKPAHYIPLEEVVGLNLWADEQRPDEAA